MKRWIVFSIILSLTYGNISETSIAENARVKEAVTFIQVWLDAQRDYEGIPGLSMAIVYDQELLWSGGFGFSNPAKKNPTTSKTIHSICSISKLFTSIAIMANQDVRFERIQKRGRPEDGDRQQFQIREDRESGWGLNSLIAQADYSITNESSLTELVDATNLWLSTFRKNIQ